MNNSTGSAYLALGGLTKKYGELDVLKNVSLDVHRGEFLTILGPSGSGKTTLLKMIAGLVVPSSGKIVFNGQDLSMIPINYRPFNTVFQDYALFPHMTVFKNISYGLMVAGISKKVIGTKVKDVMKLVGLLGFEDRFPHQLSGGQKQRVALARALVNEPSIILLDEPLSALDAVLRHQMQDFLKSVQKQTGVTFIFVTHDQEEAIMLSDRICVMNEGEIVQVGTPSDIYYQPNSAFIANFFGDNNNVPATVLESSDNLIKVSSQLGVFELTVQNHQSFKKNEIAILCVRPENIRIDTTADQPENYKRFEATIKTIEFRGVITLVSVEIFGKEIITLTLKLTSEPKHKGLRVGSTLRVTVNTHECVAIKTSNLEIS